MLGLVTGAPISHQPGFLASRLKFGKLWRKKKNALPDRSRPLRTLFSQFIGSLFLAVYSFSDLKRPWKIGPCIISVDINVNKWIDLTFIGPFTLW